jgi:hypothetical protein
VRLKAIQQLLSIPASDPQAADHWIEIRKYLLNTLKDPNEKIAVLKQFISKIKLLLIFKYLNFVEFMPQIALSNFSIFTL